MRGWSLAILVCALSARAAEEPARAPSGPVDIRSERLTVHHKEHTAVFSGKVRCVQDDLVITCDELTVTYSGKSKQAEDTAGRGTIRQMVFTGNVAIEQKERRGHCARAVYDRTRTRIVCTGDPWVVEGDNRIHGERIEYDLERDEIEVVKPRAVLRLEREQETARTKPEGTRR